MIQITTKRQMTKKHVKKSNKSQAQEKADNHIAMCVMVKSWILGDGHQPIGLIWWDDHTMFCFES